MKFTLIGCLLGLLLIAQRVSAQSAGDFQSNGTGGGHWTDPTTWQAWDVPSGTWMPATVAPDFNSNLVAILSGDSVDLTSTLTIDQVTVKPGGILTFFGPSAATVTLNNNPTSGAIINDGKVYLAGGQMTLTGAGIFQNDNTGIFTVEFSPTLSVNTTNDGEMDLQNTAVISLVTITNNKLINWVNSGILLSLANIINNDSISIQPGASMVLNGTGTETFTNAVGGIIFATDPAVNALINSNVQFINQGVVKGFGAIGFPGTTTNTGSIAPGNNSAAVLTADAGFLSTGSPTFQIGLYTVGDVAGANYSQIASSSTLDVTGKTLTVTDAAADVVGTSYTLFTASSITGTFATVNLPPSLVGSLVIGPTTITVTKTAPLPLTWGTFTATAAGTDKVLLNWTTLQEFNTAQFIIERSSDGSSFTSIGTVAAKGNSSAASAYSFTDPNPSSAGFNYYRLLQTDLDGKKSYSIITVVSLGKEKSVIVQTTPNPVKDMLNITVQADNVTIIVNDMAGRSMKTLRLARGFHQATVSDLPTGVYQLAIYEGTGKMIDSRQIIKL